MEQMTRGEQFRMLRKGLKITQEKCAERAGISVDTIVRFENKHVSIKLETYELLLKGLGCQIKIERIKEERKK